MKRLIKCATLNKNPRSNEYDEYLTNHIEGVRWVWEERIEPNLFKNKKFQDNITAITEAINNHDKSKYDEEEYSAYCNYFYPCDGFEKDEAAFDRAWLMHQHKNPHHHQHWVLSRDGGERVPLDMPIEECVNMLADWGSFALKDEESTAHNWWDKNKNSMTLSDNTIETIESILDLCPEL